MKHQEKKYRVVDFIDIRRKLKELGAKQIKHVVNTHYYAQQTGNNVVKLVHYDSKDEVHLLQESNGTFALKKSIPMRDIKAGLQWLKSKGHQNTTLVKMDYTEYSYKGGIVGLYLINDSLHSVILDYSPREHAAIEKELGLDKAEVITVPYNKYLEQLH